MAIRADRILWVAREVNPFGRDVRGMDEVSLHSRGPSFSQNPQLLRRDGKGFKQLLFDDGDPLFPFFGSEWRVRQHLRTFDLIRGRCSSEGFRPGPFRDGLPNRFPIEFIHEPRAFGG